MNLKHLVPAVVGLAMLTGCATAEKIAEGVSMKDISGNGTFMKSAVGLNTETKIPEVSTVFVSGDYSSARSGSNSVTYREEVAASIWNAKSITRKRFLAITLTDEGSVPDAIKAVSDVLRSVTTPAPEEPAEPVEPEVEKEPEA